MQRFRKEKRHPMTLAPVTWAQQAVERHGWAHAYRVAFQAFTIIPLSAYWKNVVNWIDNRISPADKEAAIKDMRVKPS